MTFTREMSYSARTIWVAGTVTIVASIAGTLFVTATFPIVVAFCLHLVASTVFIRKGIARATLAAITYWLLSNVVLLGLAVWGVIVVHKGALFL